MYNNRATWTKRQKVLIIITAITFGILIWQIYSLVRSDLYPSSAKNSDPTQLSQTNTTQAQAPTGSINSSEPTGSPNSSTISSPSSSTNNSLTYSDTENTPQEANQLPAQIYQDRTNFTPNQAEYMRYSREFELAKLQRRLLEEQVAIANARKSIADTEQQTNKLMGSGANIDDFNKSNWHLTFISFHDGQWHATITHDGDYHNVIAGMKLLDGTKILQIDKSGVIFEYHGITKHLSFAGIRTVPNHRYNTTTENPAPLTQSLSTPPMESDQDSKIESKPSSSLPVVPAPIEKKAPAVPTSALPNFQQQNSVTNTNSNSNSNSDSDSDSDTKPIPSTSQPNAVSSESQTLINPGDAVKQLSSQLDSLKSSLQSLNRNQVNS